MLDGEPAAGIDELEVVHAAYRLVAELTTTGGCRPWLLVIDDVQWADRSSVTFLLYLAQRLADLPVALLLSVRTGEATAVEDLLARLLGEVGRSALTLDPLSAVLVEADEVRQLFNDTDADQLWLVAGAPPEAANTLEMTEEQLRALYPDGPKALPPELADRAE